MLEGRTHRAQNATRWPQQHPNDHPDHDDDEPGDGRAARTVPIGPGNARHRFGRELRGLREARSMRLEDAAAWLEVAPSTLSRIETGKAPTRVSYLVVLLITTTRTTEVRAMHDTFTALAQAAMTPANSERLIKNLTRRGVAA